MIGLRWVPAIATLTLAAACGGEARKPAAADSTAAPGTASGSPAGPSRVEGFQHPESAAYDADLDVWYVSNINGSPVEKDGNGYISRLKGDGTVDSLKFIVGGQNGVTLNAPKGMAIQGDTLWVADIDAVRAFDRRTGAPVATVDLAGQAKFLNDVAIGPDAIYVTDTGVEGTPSGINHTGPDQIFRIGPEHRATVALRSDSLTGPNGIAWDGVHNRFVIVPFAGNVVRAWTPGSKRTEALGTTKGQLDGLEVLDSARLLITSWADSSLFVFEHGRAVPVAGGLPSPADIGIDTRRHRVAIPLLMEDRVEFRSLPAGGAGLP
jgi:sugar lactone lactonase YvrE